MEIKYAHIVLLAGFIETDVMVDFQLVKLPIHLIHEKQWQLYLVISTWFEPSTLNIMNIMLSEIYSTLRSIKAVRKCQKVVDVFASCCCYNNAALT